MTLQQVRIRLNVYPPNRDTFSLAPKLILSHEYFRSIKHDFIILT